MTQESVIHEVEVEFPSARPTPVAAPGWPTPDALAALQLLWEHRRLLLRVTIWALVISTFIAFLIPRKYDSSVTIMPPDSLNNEGLMMAALAGKVSPGLASLSGNLLGVKSSGALFVSLGRSRTVQDHIVERFNLQRVYWERYQQDARETLNERTEIGEDRKSGVITLTVRDRNRERARDIARAYVEELNRLVSEVSTSSARRERVFIEQRLASVRGDLEDAEKQFSQFASKNSVLDITEQTKAMVESAALLQGQLIAAQSELQSLEQVYTGNNVRVRALRARVEELKRQLQKMGGTDSSLVSEATQSDQLYPSIRRLPLLGVQWADLYRRMKTQETLYELLNQQFELARIQEAKEIPTVNVVDSPSLPEKKSSPPRLVMILALTLLSVAGAAVWIIGSARWEQVDPKDPGKMWAEGVWREASGPVRTWFVPALARLRLSRFLRRNVQEPSE